MEHAMLMKLLFFAVAVFLASQNFCLAAPDCRLAGTWRAANGDTLILTGADASQIGRFDMVTTFVTMHIRGEYRLENGATTLHLRGQDDFGRRRDLIFAVALDNPSAPTKMTLSSDNKIDPRPEPFDKQASGTCS
jgi:hypothetical protein